MSELSVNQLTQQLRIAKRDELNQPRESFQIDAEALKAAKSLLSKKELTTLYKLAEGDPEEFKQLFEQLIKEQNLAGLSESDAIAIKEQFDDFCNSGTLQDLLAGEIQKAIRKRVEEKNAA